VKFSNSTWVGKTWKNALLQVSFIFWNLLISIKWGCYSLPIKWKKKVSTPLRQGMLRKFRIKEIPFQFPANNATKLMRSTKTTNPPSQAIFNNNMIETHEIQHFRIKVNIFSSKLLIICNNLHFRNNNRNRNPYLKLFTSCKSKNLKSWIQLF